jgi:hypothetical protein
MSAIDESTLGRFLPLVLEVNRMCARPDGEALMRSLTHLAALAPEAFDAIAPQVRARVEEALDAASCAPVIPFPGPRAT